MNTQSPTSNRAGQKPSAAQRPIGGLRHRLPALATGLAVIVAVACLASPGLAREDGNRKSDWRAVSRAIDQVIEAKLEAEGVKPAARSDDAEFLRRLYLDVLGTVPTPDEVEAFVADRSRDKREGKIDELIGSESYAENQATYWFRTLTGLSVHQRRIKEGQGGRFIAGEAGKTFNEWLSAQVAANRPFNEMAQDLISATGRTDENGAAGYIARWENNANNTAGAVARHFLGVQIQCAQCHDHIYETEWKQKDFQGMASFFALTSARRVPEYQELQRLRRQMQGKGGKKDRAGAMDEMGGAERREAGKRMRELAKYRNVVDVQDAQVRPGYADRMSSRMKRAKNPRLKERAVLMSTTPKFWLGAEAADLPGISRRYLLARWVTSDDNPFFARTLTNRMWGTFMGRGIVNPVDDFNSFQEPSHPKVLEILSADFKASGYDLQRLHKILLNTETYQRSSRWTEEEEPDASLFARAPVRPLNTEQLYFALVRATGVETALNRVSRRQGQQIQQAIFATFTFVFDDDEGKAEEDFQGSIPQGLFLMNGELLQRALSGGKAYTGKKDGRRFERFRRRPAQSMLEQLLRDESSDSARVDQLYLRAYGRRPDSSERSGAVKFVKSKGATPQAYEDLFWAILNSAEFMTNH